MAPVPKLEFTFRFVVGGNVQGLLSTNGQVDPTNLTLGPESLPLDKLIEATRREDRLILGFADATIFGATVKPNVIDGWVLVIELSSPNAREVHRFLNKVGSHYQLEAVRGKLQEEGKVDQFRMAECPHCKSEIDLSGLDRSPYVYCRFCESIFEEGGRIIANGEEYRICPECELFGRVGFYTEFTFYFLLVVYGWSMQRRQMCDSCAASLFWGLLFKNLIFVLGVIPALWLKAKTMIGRQPEYAELFTANPIALEGRFQEADPLYETTLRRFPGHPGLLFSQALGRFIGKNAQGGHDCLNKTMESCANYLPAIRFIQKISKPD